MTLVPSPSPPRDPDNLSFESVEDALRTGGGPTGFVLRRSPVTTSFGPRTDGIRHLNNAADRAVCFAINPSSAPVISPMPSPVDFSTGLPWPLATSRKGAVVTAHVFREEIVGQTSAGTSGSGVVPFDDRAADDDLVACRDRRLIYHNSLRVSAKAVQQFLSVMWGWLSKKHEPSG